MAQLGARLNGIQEVRGSIPLSSTIIHYTNLVSTNYAVRFFTRLNPIS